MSGPENLRGVDYQISCTLLLLLNILVDDGEFSAAQIESLDDDGEDLALLFKDGRRLEIQIKKLAEGYNWTPASLRPVLRRFATLPESCECLFLSDGSASRELGPLRAFLEGNKELTHELVAAVCNDEFTEHQLRELSGRVRIRTRHFPSSEQADPARAVRSEVTRIISAGSFALAGTMSDVTSRLWTVVFEAARAAEMVARDDVLEQFSKAGVRPISSTWARYPTIDRFYAHAYSVNDVAQILSEGRLALVSGIGGSGKSALIAEGAVNASENGRRSCWFTLSALVEPEDVIEILGQYCHAVGLPEVQETLRSAERANLSAAIAGAVGAFPLSIVVDRLEEATARTQTLIESVVSMLPATELTGSVVLVGRAIPIWWADIVREKPYALQVSLVGLPLNSALTMLRDLAVGDTDEDRALLVEKLGGHAQSLFLLSYARNEEANDLKTIAVELAHDWLLRRVLEELPHDEREALARLSVFSYSAPIGAAVAVLDPMSKELVRSLQRRELVRLELNKLTMHDAIRSAAAQLLAPSTAAACHRAAANYFLAEIVQEFEREDFVAFDMSIPWAVHLDAAHQDGAEESGRFSIILEADDDTLLALFAIDKSGFPFAFGDPELEKAISLLEQLEEDNLVEENPVNKGKKRLVGPMFTLIDFSFYDRLLITSLCYHGGFAAGVGFIEDMRPNFAYGQQGLFCPWEHCIELSPLPMGSRADWAAGLADDRRRLADPEKFKLTEKNIEVLTARIAEGVPDWVPEMADHDLESRACFMFGHACPGGEAQAKTCRELESFEWASEPNRPSAQRKDNPE